MSDDNPGIKFPPPLVHFIAILLGLGLSRTWPVHVVPESVAMPLGIAVVVFGVALSFMGLRELHRHKTTPRPDAAASTIVTSGPYRFTRNPLYVALSTLQLGIGLWSNNLWVVLMLVPAWIVMTTQVIAREEAYLQRSFGEEYSRYKASVRRWI